MIKNEKQFRVTKSQLSSLKKALTLADTERQIDIHPILIEAQKDAIRSQLDELTMQIEEYEMLKLGAATHVEVDSFDLLPIGLIKARIAKGLSQRELAERLNLKEQQIQKYEATEYATASFERLKEIIAALGIRVREDIFLSDSVYSKDVLFKNLEKSGIKKEFVMSRLIPQRLRTKLDQFAQLTEEEARNLLLSIVTSLSKVFSIQAVELLKPNAQVIYYNVPGTRYKKPTNLNAQRTAAYTVYAHTLALILHQASKTKVQQAVPEDPFQIRRIILAQYGIVNFENVLRYIWSLGIPVIALNDPGAFHGACWRFHGFNVIVLKQAYMSEASWIHDALHELCHAGQNAEQASLDIIETGEKSRDQLAEEDEADANYFAAEVFLGEGVDEIAEESIIKASGDLRRLKLTVEATAQKYDLDVGGLANYIAFRLMKEQNVDWWGAARNLQGQGFSPWSICSQMVLENCDLLKLNIMDRDLLIMAIA